jgi:signal transduction histidine kinase
MKETEIIQKLVWLSDELSALSVQRFLEQLPDIICQMLDVSVCVIWKLNERSEKFKFQVYSASENVGENYRQAEIDINHPMVKSGYLSQPNQLHCVDNIKDMKNSRLILQEQIQANQWHSLAILPLGNVKVIAWIELFSFQPNGFTNLDIDLLKILGSYALSAIYKLESTVSFPSELTEIMLEMLNLSEPMEIWNSLKQGVSKLVQADRIWIAKLDHQRGQLVEIETNNRQSIEGGIIKRALAREELVYQKERSEMAIPILINNLLVQVGKKPESGSKCFGLLQINRSGSFSQDEEQHLRLLTSFAAICLERLESDDKIRELRKIERKINRTENYEQIIGIIIEAVTKVLGFTWVNISLINPQQTEIKTEYVGGTFLNEDDCEKFKKSVFHPLEDKDIQSDIIKHKEVEVINKFDKRLDKKIYDKYRHELLIRVFIPMIEPSSGLVTGTVEIGYQKKYRRYIYEQDIQILKNFVDYAAHRLERTKTETIDIIMHEFKSPIASIRNDADFLLRHKLNKTITHLEEDEKRYVAIKVKDIFDDSEILVYQLEELEHLLGTPNARKLKLSKTVVFRDIIVKTINQLNRTIKRLKLTQSQIEYNKDDIHRIVVWTDKAKLNQVVYNLLTNCLKYAQKFPHESAKKDPNKFKVEIEVDEDSDTFIISFKDWGIGIDPEYETKVFAQGFRSPKARNLDVLGSGLGLYISQNIMKQLGGDLRLSRNRAPTEFQIILPKQPPSNLSI